MSEELGSSPKPSAENIGYFISHKIIMSSVKKLLKAYFMWPQTFAFSFVHVSKIHSKKLIFNTNMKLTNGIISIFFRRKLNSVIKEWCLLIKKNTIWVRLVSVKMRQKCLMNLFVKHEMHVTLTKMQNKFTWLSYQKISKFITNLIWLIIMT